MQHYRAMKSALMHTLASTDYRKRAGAENCPTLDSCKEPVGERAERSIADRTMKQSDDGLATMGTGLVTAMFPIFQTLEGPRLSPPNIKRSFNIWVG